MRSCLPDRESRWRDELDDRTPKGFRLLLVARIRERESVPRRSTRDFPRPYPLARVKYWDMVCPQCHGYDAASFEFLYGGDLLTLPLPMWDCLNPTCLHRWVEQTLDKVA